MKIENSSNPFVSIALATYNGGLYLREQLDSLLGQTYQNFEIVVTDDGSTDDTVSILEEYQMKNQRIHYTKNSRGKGVISNFTEAISLCRGEIIFLCDQDDVWHRDKLKKHVAAYADTKVAWVYNEVRLTDKDNNQIGLLTDELPSYWTRRKLLYYTWGSCVLGCATSYRTSILKDIWPADPLAPGHDSWIQLAIYPAHPFYIREILQDYRQHGKNVVGVPSLEAGYTGNVELAIANNLAYLKSLSKNQKLKSWKRVLFVIVLSLKKIRSLLSKSRKLFLADK